MIMPFSIRLIIPSKLTPQAQLGKLWMTVARLWFRGSLMRNLHSSNQGPDEHQK
jgi:hypothetical protein